MHHENISLALFPNQVRILFSPSPPFPSELRGMSPPLPFSTSLAATVLVMTGVPPAVLHRGLAHPRTVAGMAGRWVPPSCTWSRDGREHPEGADREGEPAHSLLLLMSWAKSIPCAPWLEQDSSSSPHRISNR